MRAFCTLLFNSKTVSKKISWFDKYIFFFPIFHWYSQWCPQPIGHSVFLAYHVLRHLRWPPWAHPWHHANRPLTIPRQMPHKFGVFLHLSHHHEPWGLHKALLHLVQFEKNVVDCWFSWLMEGKGHFLIRIVASLYNLNRCIKSSKQVNQNSNIDSSIRFRYSGIELRSTMYIETAVWTSPISAKCIRVSLKIGIQPHAGLEQSDWVYRVIFDK